MPTFDDAASTTAPPEDVWKALYDPARFPEWWSGVATVKPGGDGGFTMYPDGYPDFPMPQTIRTADGRVTVSCQVSDLVFEWRLNALPDGGTRIAVHVDIPDAEAHRLDGQRAKIHDSLMRLAALAA
jgi:polyketide cyclase/dehydrase/lipid transport protein